MSAKKQLIRPEYGSCQETSTDDWEECRCLSCREYLFKQLSILSHDLKMMYTAETSPQMLKMYMTQVHNKILYSPLLCSVRSNWRCAKDPPLLCWHSNHKVNIGIIFDCCISASLLIKTDPHVNRSHICAAIYNSFKLVQQTTGYILSQVYYVHTCTLPPSLSLTHSHTELWHSSAAKYS